MKQKPDKVLDFQTNPGFTWNQLVWRIRSFSSFWPTLNNWDFQPLKGGLPGIKFRDQSWLFLERALTSNRQTDQRGTNRIAFPPEGFWLYRVPLWPLSGDISDNACQNCPPNRVFTEYCRISPEYCWISNAKLQIDFFSPITQLTMLEMIEHLTMRPFVISKFIVTWPKTC